MTHQYTQESWLMGDNSVTTKTLNVWVDWNVTDWKTQPMHNNYMYVFRNTDFNYFKYHVGYGGMELAMYVLSCISPQLCIVQSLCMD